MGLSTWDVGQGLFRSETCFTLPTVYIYTLSSLLSLSINNNNILEQWNKERVAQREAIAFQSMFRLCANES
jgi:hypothetical protein